jgi:hypothetical protein
VNRFLLRDADPIGVPRRGRDGAALVVSAVLHGIVVASAVILARGETEEARADSAAAADRTVQLMYMPPPAPAPQAASARRPRPTPRRPAAPPMPQVPDHDEPAGRTAEAAPPQELATAAAAETPASAPVGSSRPAPLSGAEIMRNEAQRLFGRGSRPRVPRGGPAAEPGFEIYVPPQSDGCAPVRPRDAGEPVTLATVSGRVYRQGTRIPLPGAHLQMIGTPYVAFSSDDGAYDLRFDPTLVDRCRTQYVRVTAPGFRAQTLVLYLGPSASNDIPMSQR